MLLKSPKLVGMTDSGDEEGGGLTDGIMATVDGVGAPWYFLDLVASGRCSVVQWWSDQVLAEISLPSWKCSGQPLAWALRLREVAVSSPSAKAGTTSKYQTRDSLKIRGYRMLVSPVIPSFFI